MSTHDVILNVYNGFKTVLKMFRLRFKVLSKGFKMCLRIYFKSVFKIFQIVYQIFKIQIVFYFNLPKVTIDFKLCF